MGFLIAHQEIAGMGWIKRRAKLL